MARNESDAVPRVRSLRRELPLLLAVAVLLGWFVLAEPLTSSTLVAAAAIVVSVLLIVGSRAVPSRGKVIPFPGVLRTAAKRAA